MGLLSKIISLGIVISSLYPQLKSLRFKKGISKEDEESIEKASERALLKEYEACQSHNNALGQQSWVSISILITVNLLVLAQVIPNLVLKAVPSDWAGLTSVVILGLVMIFILWIFQRWQNRITFLAWINNFRMQDIESTLGMWKNWRARGQDLFYKLQRLQGRRGKEDKYQRVKDQWNALTDEQKQESVAQMEANIDNL